ncbi:MAG: hypothetical protein KGI70_03085 [Patescibacteria group bacterium]|nr:hypothetical protein [Patescibacteria group bacterium]
MRDIRHDSDRSIRNIPLSKRSDQKPLMHRTRRRRSWRWLWWGIAVVVVCGGLGLFLSVLFAGATVKVHPKEVTVTAPATLQATLTAQPEILQYQPFTLTQSASTTIPASGTRQVSKQASGVLTILNNYSTASQRLIANTRFQAGDGKVYRIHDSVVVPGLKGGVPGTASITAYADSPGDSYNRSGNTAYTIPGFKGDPRYTKITASSGPISGGFVGMQPAVAQNDLDSATQTLERGLDAAARGAVANQIPDTLLLVPGSLTVSFGMVTQTPNGDNSATIAQTATAQGYIVQKADLAAAVAAKTIPAYKGEAVAFADPSALTVSFATTSKPAPETITLNLSGSPTLVWQFDANALKQALLGKDKSQFQQIVASFEPAIECTAAHPCSAAIRPFWSSTFPSDPSKISIKILLN